MPIARVHRISAAAPNDISGIAAAIGEGRIDPKGIVAILGKTEGNGNVNDFTRGYATLALTLMLEKHLGVRAKDVCLVMSGGTEGAMAPHWTVFERAQDATHTGDDKGAALAIGRAHTPELKPEQMGRLAQVDQVADGVRAAMADAGIDDPAGVHFGVAVALGEIARDALTDAAIGVDTSLWSGRASASAGIELMNHEIVVLGMSAQWSGPLSIDHAVMRDAIDIAPVRGAFHRLGFTAAGQLAPSERLRLVAVLAKAEASHDGLLRGHRHTMLDDSDISSTRHARAFVAGALAGLVGHAEIYVSGGAEHQGPDGGGPVALIVTRPA
jgi:cyanuric acid amidohydrolase